MCLILNKLMYPQRIARVLVPAHLPQAQGWGLQPHWILEMDLGKVHLLAGLETVSSEWVKAQTGCPAGSWAGSPGRQAPRGVSGKP